MIIAPAGETGHPKCQSLWSSVFFTFLCELLILTLLALLAFERLNGNLFSTHKHALLPLVKFNFYSYSNLFNTQTSIQKEMKMELILIYPPNVESCLEQSCSNYYCLLVYADNVYLRRYNKSMHLSVLTLLSSSSHTLHTTPLVLSQKSLVWC